VLELAEGIAGPYAGCLFASLGAEVIKVEPASGDRARRLGPFPQDEPHPDRSGTYIALNGCKRAVALDLGQEDARGLVRSLALGAHVVIHDRLREDAAKAGLDEADLLSRRPDLVLVSVTPFGQDGPYSRFAGEEIVYQALSGCMDITGEPQRAPLQIGVPLAQVAAGLHAFLAAMACLLQPSGRGRQIDVSIFEAMCSLTEHSPFFWSYRGKLWKRRGNWAGVAGWGLYPCRDGYVGVVSGIGDAWSRFIAMLGLDDPALMRQSARTTHAGEIHAAIFRWLDGMSKEEAYRLAQERYKLPFGYLCGPREALASAQLRARRFWRAVRQPDVGQLRLPGPPFRVAGWRWKTGSAPRLLSLRRRVSWRSRAALLDAPAAARRSVLPLEGVRVLDFGQVWAGPHCAKVLAQLGAQVIKIESPRRPDLLRGPTHPYSPAEGCYPDDEPGERPFDRHAYFNDRNLGKLGIAVDAAHPDGLEVLRDLVAASDVLIENFSPGVMARMGLGYDQVKRLNPRIVYLSMPANGNTGPEASYSAYGITNDLMSGMVKATGYPGEPQNLGINASDPIAGLHGASAVVTALWVRRKTGKGAFIDLSQRESALRVCFPQILDYQMNGRDAEPMGNRHPSLSPHNCYPCLGEDRWICIAVPDDEAWQALVRLMGEPGLASDPRFASAAQRKAHEDVLDGIICGWTSGQEARELMDALQSAGVPAGAVANAAELMEDPHLLARGFLHDIDHPAAGRRRHLGEGFLLTPPGYRPTPRPAPCFGEHNETVLKEVLNYSSQRIQALLASGAIASAPLDFSINEAAKGKEVHI